MKPSGVIPAVGAVAVLLYDGMRLLEQRLALAIGVPARRAGQG